MESKFICEFPLTEKLLANRYRNYNSTRWAIMLVIGIVTFAYIVRCGILDMYFHGFSLFWCFLILVACALLLYCCFWPRTMAKAQLRRYCKELGTDLYRVTFGENIEIQEGSLRVTWNYADITSVARWKYTVELRKSKNLAVMLSPDGFTEGTFEKFKAFLREKRPDLTIPD